MSVRMVRMRTNPKKGKSIQEWEQHTVSCAGGWGRLVGGPSCKMGGLRIQTSRGSQHRLSRFSFSIHGQVAQTMEEGGYSCIYKYILGVSARET